MTNQVDFQIIAETEDLLLLSKPPHLLVHPSKPGDSPTLWDHLRELLLYERTTGGQISLINRLDRETSGLMLVAKTYQAARYCAMAMEQRKIKKEYLALVLGHFPEEERLIDEPIIRLGEVSSSEVWLKRAIHPKGAPAQTQVSIEKKLLHPNYGAISLLRCIPKTGRTHQIRVHLSSLGYPILGDKIYGPSEKYYLQFIDQGWTPQLAEKLYIPRHALHSAALEFSYQGEEERWESPLSGDLEEILQACSIMDDKK